MKQLLKGDLKHLGIAFVKVYPMTFRRLFMHWQLTLAALFAIISAFYLDNAIQSLVKGMSNNITDAIFEFGRWYGNGMPTLYLFLGLYICGLILKFNDENSRN